MSNHNKDATNLNERQGKTPKPEPNNQKVKDLQNEPNTKDPVTDEHLKSFPERRGGPIYHKSLIKDVKTEREMCEYKTLSVIKNYPLIKLLERAMKAHGCELDYRRHFSCEPCVGKITGGYDVFFNQIVVCSNKYMSKGQFMGTIGHEMIHMFDACRAKLDFTNPEHVACTEECVREKAFLSLIASIPDLDHDKAYKIIDKVFDKCYNDMEPFGRHIQNFKDSLYAYRERYLYGYP